MKALIFNSGIGKRMGALTAHSPKSMVHLYNDETIFERQIRLIQEAGIREVVITTGPYPEMIKEICNKECFQNMHFVFSHNEKYDQTNYIYSMYNAREYLNDDVIMMHGDLVFDRTLIPSMLKNKKKDLCLINKLKVLPEKDFKGRIIDGTLKEVSISIFEDNCYAFQPLYKLSKESITKWVDTVINFVERGIVNVYAENALNEISNQISIFPMSYSRHFIDEVDNPNDLKRVSNSIEKWDAKTQRIYHSSLLKNKINSILLSINATNPLFVVDSFLVKKIEKMFNNPVIFSRFTSNPKYEEMLSGLTLFKEKNCDALVSIGGGSCIDVAKAIKLSLNSNLESGVPTFRQKYQHASICHIAVPTTSGTGSESTRHSVLYLNGEKQSISNSAILPEYVTLHSTFIITVPDYQKKCTAMDAFCQCVESLWSRKATKESKKYALKGIQLFAKSYRGYINNNTEDIKAVQVSANLSGKAINISETTAGHAMSYKITSLYGIPHGHAVAMAINSILHNCKVKTLFGGIDIKELFIEIMTFFDLDLKIKDHRADAQALTESVNALRIRNFKYKINVKKCYLAILK